jgi:lantibiotic modifying enzyme
MSCSHLVSRCHENTLDSNHLQSILPSNDQLIECIDKYLHSQLKQLDYESIINSSTKYRHTVYTGYSGFTYLHLYMYRQTGEQHYLQQASRFVQLVSAHRTLLKQSDKIVDERVGFLSGDAGSVCLCAIVYRLSGNDHSYNKMLQWLVALKGECLYDLNEESLEISSELLIGRIGLVLAYLMLNHYFNENIIDYHTVIHPVVDKILEVGREPRLDHLSWRWHDKEYIGAVHGIAGILKILLHIDEVKRDVDIMNDIEKTCDWLVSIQYDSGNIPSSGESKSDRLMQFCHGAPGVLPLILQMYHITKKQSYLDCCIKACDAIWRYGILTKGPSLCHGICGNLYPFLLMSKVIDHNKYLNMAKYFAIKGLDCAEKNTPPRPLNLFEGYAGVCISLFNVKQQLQTQDNEIHFPAFDLM